MKYVVIITINLLLLFFLMLALNYYNLKKDAILDGRIILMGIASILFLGFIGMVAVKIFTKKSE